MEVYRLSGIVHHLISISRCYDLLQKIIEYINFFPTEDYLGVIYLFILSRAQLSLLFSSPPHPPPLFPYQNEIVETLV